MHTTQSEYLSRFHMVCTNVVFQINSHYALFTSWRDLIFPQTAVIATAHQHIKSFSIPIQIHWFNDMLDSSFTCKHHYTFAIGYSGARKSNILNNMLRIAIFSFNNNSEFIKIIDFPFEIENLRRANGIGVE